MDVLNNTHVGLLCRERFGVTKGSLIGLFSVDRKRMDLLITSSCVVELFMDSESVPSSWERQTIVDYIKASVAWNIGM